MNRILLIILSLFFINCADSKSKNFITENKQNIDTYIKVDATTITTNNDWLSISKFAKIDLPISLIFFFESEKTFLNIEKKYYPILWNYEYQQNTKGSKITTEKILIFKNKNNYIFLFPTNSEEFPTFHVVGVDKAKEFRDYGLYTYTYNDFDKLSGITFDKLNYIVEDGNKIINLYAILNNDKIKLSDVTTSKSYIEEITEKERNKIDNFVNETSYNREVEDIIYHKKIDINGDKIPDEIIVKKNNSKSDDFEKNHFKLPLEIILGNKGRGTMFNNNLIFDNISTCVSEGFSDVIVKDNFFTIEGQTCYDYNVLVSYYITFKVVDKSIFLYKYSEEYFDKSDHDKKIPSRYFTTKDFGVVKFEDVNEEFLIALRKKEE